LNKNGVYLTAGDWSILTSITFGGMLIYLFIVMYGTVGGQDRFIRFDAPGEIELTLDWSGTYMIFQEFRRTPDSKGEMRPGTADSLVARMQNVETGETIDLTTPTEIHRFNLQRMTAEGVYEFTIEQAGTYRFLTEYAQGKQSVPLRFVFTPRPVGQQLRFFFLGTAFITGVLVLVFTLAYGINWRRGLTYAKQSAT